MAYPSTRHTSVFRPPTRPRRSSWWTYTSTGLDRRGPVVGGARHRLIKQDDDHKSRPIHLPLQASARSAAAIEAYWCALRMQRFCGCLRMLVLGGFQLLDPTTSRESMKAHRLLEARANTRSPSPLIRGVHSHLLSPVGGPLFCHLDEAGGGETDTC